MPKTAGIICEFNPFHKGHEYLLAEVRRRGYAVVCVMSGNFVQRGDLAVMDKFARAESAVKCGADLVIELPLPWACSTAQRFARGGVELLKDTGICNMLFFGSECGDISLIKRAAELTGPSLDSEILKNLSSGIDYASARQRAAEKIDPECAKILASPNDILGIEYARECINEGLDFDCIRRVGSGHDGFASASWIRQHLGSDLSAYMPENALEILNREIEKGAAPVTAAAVDGAVMSVLKRMTSDDFKKLPDVSEGLEYRLERAARDEGTFEGFCMAVKTKRYALSRIRRIGISAYLGLERDFAETRSPYARVLAFNDTGRALLKDIKMPVVTKAADGVDIFGEYLELESLADDLWALGCPDPAERKGGRGFRKSPAYVKENFNT